MSYTTLVEHIVTEEITSSIPWKNFKMFIKATPQKSEIIYKTHFSQKYTLSLLTILYFIGFIPFRFKRHWNSKKGYFEWTVYTNIWQKIFCLPLHTCFLAISAVMLLGVFAPDENGKVPKNSMLDSTLAFMGTTITWYYLYIVWFKQPNFLLLVQPDKIKYTQKNYQNYTEKIENIFATLCPFLTVTSSVYQFYTMNDLSFKLDYRTWTTNHLFALLLILLIVLFNVPNIVFLAISLRFRDKSKIFLEFIHNSQFSDTDDIIKEYYKLDSYANQLNDKFGVWILLASTLSIPFLSQKLVELFKGSVAVTAAILNIQFAVVVLFNLSLAASICHKISDSMHQWLNRNPRNIQFGKNELSIILSKLNTNPTGLRGMQFFLITYPFIGSVISLIITYAFIDEKNSSPRFDGDILNNGQANVSGNNLFAI